MATLTVSAADEKRVKAMGFLSNKGTDNFNARIITVNGKITAEQQRCIAEAAEKFGNGEVAFTTRLTVEVPGVPYDKIEEFQEFIGKQFDFRTRNVEQNSDNEKYCKNRLGRIKRASRFFYLYICKKSTPTNLRLNRK